jgi:uncharacterized protein (TIGR03000 family)
MIGYLGVAAATFLAFGASNAQAGWYGSYGSSGSSGSYGSYGSSGSSGSSGSYGSSGSSGSWGSHGSHGSHGGLFARWRAKHYYRHSSHGSSGSYGSYGSSHSSGGSYSSYGSSHSSGGSYSYSSYGSSGSSGGSYSYSSYGSSGSSGGSYGSSGSSGGTVYYSAPSKVYSSPMKVEGGEVYESAPSIPEPPADGGDATATSTDATLTVTVPEGAKIFVNGSATTSTGNTRRYVSRGLSPGYRYTYEVRAEVERNGEKVEETKTVQVEAGRQVQLAFALEAPANPVTTLTVNVPENAKVYLAGTETSGTGAVRVFKTSKLKDGESWANYTVRVALDQDGQTLDMEKVVDLQAGDSQSLTFDFDAPQVASR